MAPEALRDRHRHRLAVRVVVVGPEDDKLGPPTQMAILEAAK